MLKIVTYGGKMSTTVHLFHIFIIVFQKYCILQGKIEVPPRNKMQLDFKIFFMYKRVFKMFEIVTYGERMLKLYIQSTFSLLYLRNTVFSGLKLWFRPEIAGSRQFYILIMFERVFKVLIIVTQGARMPKMNILSTFFIIVTSLVINNSGWKRVPTRVS